MPPKMLTYPTLIALGVFWLPAAAVLAFGTGRFFLAGLVLLADIVAILLLDGRGFVTMRGRFDRLPRLAIGMIWFLIVFSLWIILFIPGVYLGFAWYDRAHRRTTPLNWIDELERELGMKERTNTGRSDDHV